jgi:hypothetical protein
MKPDETLDIAEKILERIDRSIFKAISLAALFGRAANQGDDLRPHFDNSPAAAGYNTVLDSLYFELVLTVARLFDAEKRDAVTPTTASIPVIVSLLEEPGVIDALRARKRRRHDPEKVTGMDTATKRDYRKRIFARIDQEISDLPPLLERLRNLKGHKLLRSIRRARNDFMAHTAIAPSQSDVLTYGQAEDLLAVAEPLLTTLQYSIRSYHPEYKDEAKRQAARADEFWKRASCQTPSQQPPA